MVEAVKSFHSILRLFRYVHLDTSGAVVRHITNKLLMVKEM